MTRSMLERAIHLGYRDPARGHVPNPGMGLQGYVFSDHMHYGFDPAGWRASERSDPNRPLPRHVFDRMLELPYVDNLYFRADWNRVQTRAGALDLPPEWEWMLEAVEQRGKRWSFRIMNASRHSLGEHSVPDFLAERLPRDSYANEYEFGPSWKGYPRYTAEYLKWWGELMGLLAERFDAHPLLEFVDVSGFGIWGEGHHYGRHDPTRPDIANRYPQGAERAVDQLVKDHLAAFRATPVAMTLHYLDFEAGHAALENPEVWLRRDSFQPFTSTLEYEAMSRSVPGRAVIWETIVPALGDERPPVFHADKIAQRFLDFTAHYVAVGFNPWDAILAHEQRPEVYELLADRLGYRLRPSIVWRRATDAGRQELVVALVNDGTADVPGTLSLTAEYADGEARSVTLPPGRPRPGDRQLTVVEIPPTMWDRGSEVTVTLRLGIRIRGKQHPVRWAVREATGDPFTVRLPLRQPAPGDPFTMPAGAYDPEF